MDNKYDVVIKSHPKDYFKLGLVVDSLKFINPEPENIYILSPDGFYPKNTIFDSKIIYISDDQVTPFIDRNKLKQRPNWNWINLVSLFQTFTENDLYFDVQSDNFFIKPIDLFDQFGKPKLFQSTANECNNCGHRPYFDFSEKVFDLPKIGEEYSYIIEFLMYDKKLLKKLFENYSSFEEMMEKIYNTVNQSSYPADQEIYGNLIEKYFSDKYEIVPKFPINLIGSHIPPSYNELVSFIEENKKNPEIVSCSYHTWL
jgi:hypothetical protein